MDRTNKLKLNTFVFEFHTKRLRSLGPVQVKTYCNNFYKWFLFLFIFVLNRGNNNTEWLLCTGKVYLSKGHKAATTETYRKVIH